MPDPERTTTIYKGPNETADLIGEVSAHLADPTGKVQDGWQEVKVTVKSAKGGEVVITGWQPMPDGATRKQETEGVVVYPHRNDLIARN